MIKADSDYKSIPNILSAFAKQFKSEHFHVHGGYHNNDAQTTLISVFKDQTNQLHQGARLFFKGGLIGLVTGYFYLKKWTGRQGEMYHTRTVLQKSLLSRRLPGWFVLGALGGLSWWFIHDLTLCPHGRQNSIQRYILAHAIQGGLMVGALYHPSAFGYGMLIGASVGFVRDNLTTPKLPKNFKLYFPNFDLQKRRNKLRDDQEYELSIRSVLHSGRVFHPI